ncbi:MAG: SulP family inorganic anion transporter [Verrucomicrobiota bacterium]
MNFFRGIPKAYAALREYFTNEPLDPLPIRHTMRGISLGTLRADSWAGLNVTMLAVPQAIAFAAIAGVPIVDGILCAIVAAVVGAVFASSRHTVLGPTNATAFMLFSFFALHPDQALRAGELTPLLVILAGILATIGAALKVADLLQYVSRSVLVGYIAGAAVLIIANQIKHWLGIDARMDPRASGTLIGLVIELAKTVRFTNPATFVIGLFAVGLFFAIRKWLPRWPVFAISLIVTSVVFGPLVHFKYGIFKGVETFTTFTLGDLQPHLPQIRNDLFFADLASLFGIAFALAFLASLENSLMSKTLSSRSGHRTDVNQDMLAVGLGNIASGVAGGMPASGSLTRSQLNFESGAQTGLASLLSGVFTLCFAVFIAASVGWGVPLIDYIPKAALGALVVMLSLSLFNVRHIRICMRSTNDDAVVLVTTFAATLLAPLHVAIFIGVAVSISLFLRKASRPHLVEYEFSDEGELREKGEKRERPIPAISIVHVEGDLFFGAADLFRTQIQRTVTDPAIKVIILRLKNARHLDATSVMALEDLIKFMRGNGLHILVSGAPKEVYKVLKQSGVLTTLQEGCVREEGETNLFIGNPHNPNLSTRDALRRAQQLIGSEKADVRIFYDPSHSAKTT